VIPSHQIYFISPFSSSESLLLSVGFTANPMRRTGESLAQAGDLLRPNWHSAVLVSITSSYPDTTKFFWEKKDL